MTPTIAIIVEGGMVRNTISDTPITAVVIDHDTEGTPDNELSHVDGVDTGVILSSKPHELDPHFVKQFREEDQRPTFTEADYDDFDSAVNYYGLDRSFQYQDRPDIMLGYIRQYRLDMARPSAANAALNSHDGAVDLAVLDPESVSAARADNLFSLTREWHDLSEEFWDDLSFRQQFELLSEMVAANAAEQATAMQNMAGALQNCVDQIQQMKGMFDDADGAISAALQDAEEALDSHHDLGLKVVERDAAAASRPSGMKG